MSSPNDSARPFLYLAIGLIVAGLLGLMFGLTRADDDLITVSPPMYDTNAMQIERIEPSDFVYLGAFTTELTYDGDWGGVPGWTKTDWAEGTIAFCPEGGGEPNHWPGTLYIGLRNTEDGTGGGIGHFDIPQPETKVDANDLPQAQFLETPVQLFPQAMDYWGRQDSRPRLGDIFWCPARGAFTQPRLYAQHYGYYNSNNDDQDTFSRVRLNGSAESPRYHIGPHSTSDDGTVRAHWKFNGLKHGRGIFEVPPAVADQFFGGRWLAFMQGNREGGHAFNASPPGGDGDVDNTRWAEESRHGCGLGPSIAVCAPDLVGSEGMDPQNGTEFDAKEILGYYDAHAVSMPPGASGDTIFSDVDLWMDGFWAYNVNKSLACRQTVGILHANAQHEAHYVRDEVGHYNGRDCCNQNDGNGRGPGYVNGTYGQSTPCFKPEIWLFDPRDLIAVGEGKPPWSPQPYAVVDLSTYFYTSGQCGCHLAGCAFNPLTGHLYVVETNARPLSETALPMVVHVFQVNTATQKERDADKMSEGKFVSIIADPGQYNTWGGAGGNHWMQGETMVASFTIDKSFPEGDTLDVTVELQIPSYPDELLTVSGDYSSSEIYTNGSQRYWHVTGITSKGISPRIDAEWTASTPGDSVFYGRVEQVYPEFPYLNYFSNNPSARFFRFQFTVDDTTQ